MRIRASFNGCCTKKSLQWEQSQDGIAHVICMETERPLNTRRSGITQPHNVKMSLQANLYTSSGKSAWQWQVEKHVSNVNHSCLSKKELPSRQNQLHFQLFESCIFQQDYVSRMPSVETTSRINAWSATDYTNRAAGLVPRGYCKSTNFGLRKTFCWCRKTFCGHQTLAMSTWSMGPARWYTALHLLPCIVTFFINLTCSTTSNGNEKCKMGQTESGWHFWLKWQGLFGD